MDGNCGYILPISTNLWNPIWLYSYGGHVADSVLLQLHYLFWNIKPLVDSLHKNMVELDFLGSTATMQHLL